MATSASAGRRLHSARRLLLLPFAFAVAGAMAWGTPAVVATDAFADVRPDSIEAVTSLDSVLPRYRIVAEVNTGDWTEPTVITGSISIRWVNDGPDPLRALPLRLYPNAPEYGEGGMSVDHVSVDGQPVEPELVGDGTVMLAPLPNPVQVGEAVELKADFQTTVPVDSNAAFGIFSVKSDDRAVALAHWHPMLAGRDDTGWSLEPFSRNGDPVFAPAAMFDVTLRAPADLVVVSSGVEVASAEVDGRIERRVRAGPVRELGLALARGWVPAASSAGEVDITVWTTEEGREDAKAILETSEAALHAFERRFGPYPYTELDVVPMDLNGAVGMEYPGLILIGPNILDAAGDGDRFAETVVAHEIAHQWWYGVVGSNHHRHAFIDEGLAEMSGVAVYLEDRYGRDIADEMWEAEVVSWWERASGRGGNLPPASATDAFADRAAYAAAVYPRAAIGFAAIREAIGDEAFFDALATTVRDDAFDVLEPEELEAAFAAACRCDIGPLWEEAFETIESP